MSAKRQMVTQWVGRFTLTFQAVMVPLNHIVESIVVDRPLLGKCSGPDRGQRKAGDPHRDGVIE